MVTQVKKAILLTGASGTIGRVLTPLLAARGYLLRLTDVRPFPDTLPEGAQFFAMDLADREAVMTAVDGVSAILHFGGVNGEHTHDAILPANVIGTSNMYEAAHLFGARMIFASSNHTIGFHPRCRPITAKDEFRPDGFYAISKIYGEMLGQLYFAKHGVQSVLMRIGSCLPRPVDVRQLSIWLSHADLERLILAALNAENPGCAIVWGISNNTRAWWRGDDAARIGYFPQDDAEAFAGDIAPVEEHPASAHYQGGLICAVDYTRDPPYLEEDPA